MLTALSNRFEAVEPLRETPGLLVASARAEGRPVMLWHRAGLDAAACAANRAAADRLRAAGASGAPLQWLQSAAGVTWVVEADEGLFLDEWLAGAPQPPLGVALRLLLDLAQALDGLHRVRVLHLRLRPGCVRVMLAPLPRARLLAAEAVGGEEAAAMPDGDTRDDFRFSAPEQSGRSAARPDARTDLYLLGLMAYQLLAGRLPFEAADALGWIHAHAAQEPQDLGRLRPEVPPALAELVHALLAKPPAHRPASARVVAEDLRRCLDALVAQRPLAGLALQAPRARFTLPRVLVGREPQRQMLAQALARARAGAVEALVLAGPSGIGKSALATHLLGEAQAQGAWVAHGKFDQFGSGGPFAALAQLLRVLGRALREAPDAARRVAEAAGPEGAALAALSPEWAATMGVPAAAAEMPPAQARQRLVQALSGALGALGRQRPLVLFVDDVQWRDGETLPLLLAALSDRAVRCVLLLLGERSDTGVPIEGEALAGSQPAPALQRCVLPALDSDALLHWLQLALPGGFTDAAATVAYLAVRSGGNPLFLGQLLDAMVLRGQLVPEADARWRLDAAAARGEALPESALQAASGRMRALGDAPAATLGLAAALGASFDETVLAAVGGTPVDALRELLRSAQQESLLEAEGAPGRWRFTHDRLQQAAYELVPQPQRLHWHLRIGRALQAAAAPQDLFEACRHLNLAAPLLDAQERTALARLDHRAALQARASAGFRPYAALMRAALAVLPAEGGVSAAQRVALLHDAADALLLERDLAGCRECLEQARALATGDLERARSDELHVHWLIAQDRAQEALTYGLAALTRLGMPLREDRATAATLWHLLRLKLLLRGRPIAAWTGAPASEDPRHLQLQRLIFATINVAHTLASPAYAVLGLAGARLSLQKGLTPWSWQPIAVAGHVLSGVFGDIATGHQLGELSVRLGERFGTHSMSFNHLFYVMHWKTPVLRTAPGLRQCFEQGERSGNFEIAGYAVSMHVGVIWNAMQSLAAVQEALDEARAFGLRHGNDLVLDCCDTFAWLLGLLRGPGLAGPIAPLRRVRADGRVLPHDPIFDLIHDQLAVMLNVTAGHFGDDVVACGERVRRNLHRMAGNFSTPLAHWFEALLHAERLRTRPSAASRRLIRRHLEKLRHWERHCPANHAHRVVSLRAELAALAGREEAGALFAESVRLGRDNGFAGDAAIVAHRWARHSARAGRPEDLRQAMELAHELFAHWGCTAMLRELEAALPAFARPGAAPQRALPLDAATLIKASQAISAELEIAVAAGQLLQHAMENAGARYGALLLDEGGGMKLAAERAEAGARLENRAGAALEQTALPQGLLRSVRAGGEAVLADARAEPAHGPCLRWASHTAVSVLCVPVVAAGGTLGALYLENELHAGCFTPERAAVARVLAAQAAIAIANARLFGELAVAHEELQRANALLEERVAQRTRQLEDNHQRLRQLERRRAADDERQRIMRDLHDGLGSQLFVTLSRVERGELAAPQVGDALRACIVDMRLVLEAMSPDGDDFLEAWGSFRFRWEGQLRDAGVASRWQAQADLPAIALPAPTALGLLRIAQEALTNVLKHAQARHVEVRLALHEGTLRLELRDDGRGFTGEPGPASRGLANMRARASRMHAALEIEPLQPGTCVRLRLAMP
ncbi:AAA family ATPase [Ramlibacter humi]|nr:AAA family ATPase [Ramlibacter humi]